MLGVLLVFGSLCAHCLDSYRLVFEENFGSGLKNWVVEETMDVSGSCSFYRNNVSNVFVDESGLHLKVTRGEFSLCPAGRLHSMEKWKYGIFVVTAKVPKKDTIWPALWLTDADGVWPNCGEIDIMETWGNRTYLMGTVHCGNSTDDPTANPGVPKFPKNIYSDTVDWTAYNTYVMNWQPNKIEFYLNVEVDQDGIKGKPLATIYNIFWSKCPQFSEMNWILNVAVGGYDDANCGKGNCWDSCQKTPW